jgi:P pilus assembly chaperone PapD
MFTHSTKSYHQMFIVIDGLDECSEEKRLPILDFIVEASSDQSSNIKVFLSSRKEPDIRSRLKNLNVPAIELETGKVTPDIQNFVRHEAMKLRSESKLLVRDKALSAEIIQRLVEMSDGM